MSIPTVIAYNPQYAALPSATGKPIGHSAALLLSQFVWLSANRSDDEGCIECSREEICKWGFTRTEQETAKRVLLSSGLIIEVERGRGKGGTRYKISEKLGGNPAVSTAENLPYSEKVRRISCPTERSTADFLPNSEPEYGGNPAVSTAENLPYSSDVVSIKNINTLEESNPPIIPPQGETSPLPKRVRETFVKPTLEQVTAYMTELGISHKAKKWMAHYEANGWKIGKNPMKDWRAACRTWVDDADKSVRGSPPDKKTQDQKDNEEREAILRIMARRQQANG